MDEYTKLKTKIESYLELPEVELTEEVISLGTLINILDSGLERLRKTQFGTEFQDEINKSHTIVEKVGEYLKRKSLYVQENVIILMLLVMVKSLK